MENQDQVNLVLLNIYYKNVFKNKWILILSKRNFENLMNEYNMVEEDVELLI